MRSPFWISFFISLWIGMTIMGIIIWRIDASENWGGLYFWDCVRVAVPIFFFLHVTLLAPTIVGLFRQPGFPRVWGLFPFILPRRIRERMYDPAHQDLLADYCAARQYRTKCARRWLTFCFAWRTGWLVVQCIQAVFTDKAMRGLAKLVPEPVKRWWISQ